ncbi:unknown [Clostridium sp. CAG:793]|nr:unknown [Clostridium sp. CAG:793]
MERTKEGESKARRTRRVNVREKAITLIAQISDEISPQ